MAEREKWSFGMSTVLQPEDVRQLLRTILWVLLGLLMVSVLANFIIPNEMNLVIIRSVFAMVGLTGISLWLLRKKQVSAAVFAVILGCGMILVQVVWSGPSLRSPAYMTFVLLVLGVTLYWGRRAGLWAALGAGAIGLGALIIRSSDWLTNQTWPFDEWFVWITFTATFVLTVLMVGLMLSYLEKIFNQLRSEEEKTHQMNLVLEQRVAERTARLAESERLLQIISENVQDVIWVMDLQLRTTFITPSATRLRGFTVQEMLEESLDQALTPDSHAFVVETLQKELERESQAAVDPHRSVVEQIDYYRKDGSTIRLEVRASFLRDEQGQVIGITGVNRDITERNWMEKALLESEERYRRITSVISDYIYFAQVDRQGQFSTEWVAGAFAEMTGYEFDEYLAAGSWKALIDPDSDVQDEADRQTLLSNRALEGPILKIRRADGEIRWVRNFAYPVWHQEENRLVGVYGAIQDITFQKEYEERLQALNDELEKRVVERTTKLENALSELESFSYSISHDLRAPLRAVNGYAGMLLAEHGAEFAPDIAEKLEAIKENGQRMGQLVDGLLEFLHSGSEEIERQQVNPGEIVQSVLQRFEAQLAGRQVEIRVTELPPCSANFRLLDKVYEGLISNAIKFTRNHEAALIEIGVLDKDGTTVYFVRDNGVGFEMKYYDKLFGVFQRLHHLSEFEGIGASLAIVQRIINRHGGRIWAEAELDKGAVFYFTLGE